MSDTFHGQWIVEVWQKDAAFDERFVIAGSDASDGAYPGVVGSVPVVVTGAEWTIQLEWNDMASSGWQPSAIRRNSAAATASDGIVVFLGADDNYEQFRDHDYNDLVLQLHSVDPDLAPWYPIAHPYDFTLPEKTWRCGVAKHTDKRRCGKVDEEELEKIREQVLELREKLREAGERKRSDRRKRDD
jgi:hypothetical protein